MRIAQALHKQSVVVIIVIITMVVNIIVIIISTIGILRKPFM